jgi:type IV pilus assembly protein PilC
MAFSARLPLSSLIDLCRALRHCLGAGLTLRDVFRQQARSGPAPARPAAGRIAQMLGQGHSLEAALKHEQGVFPPLFLALAGVGEETGNLPEIFGELEKYFLLQQRLRWQFLSRISWPVFQLVVAILAITALILILGLIAGRQEPGARPFDPLGLGLSGPSGALTFLAVVAGAFVAGAGVYLLLTRGLQQRAAVDRFLLRLPAVGPCLEAFALARFCLALRLTLETAMPIGTALRLSLRATGNEAFVAQTGGVQDALEAGDELAHALAGSGLFSEEFLNIVAVGEESGRLPEVMEQQAQYYHELAEQRLAVLTRVAGWGVWLFVAVLIVIAIFRLFLTYLGLLDPANVGL